MANTLRFKRGLASGIPTALAGEPLFTTDTFDLYIGNGTTNTRFQKYIASGATTQILRGDGSLYTFPLAISSPSNGQVLKYNGTSWVNDSDAGITGSGVNQQIAYFTGATTLGGTNNFFWDAATSRLNINTGGSNGSGTVNIRSSAATWVFLKGGSAANQGSAYYITNANNSSALCAFGDASAILGGTPDASVSLYTIASVPLTFNIGGSSERARIFATGNFGIGSTTDSGEKLQVTGTAKITGNVGIGTASDVLYPLKVERSTAGVGIQVYNSTTYSQIRLQSSGTNQSSYLTFNSTGTGRAIIQVNDTDRLTIDASGNLGIGMTPSYKLDVTGSARISDAIAIGTTPDTNNPFKILKNINATVGIKFENTNTSSSAFSAVQLGTDVTGGTKFTNLVYASSGVTASGVYNPDGTSLINNGSGGLNFLGNPIRMYTGGSNGVLRWDLVNDGYITHYSATAPTTSATDSYRQYSADVVAGNAAPHFRTENGAVIKLYQETTAVGNSTISVGGGNAVLDDTEFGGYTLRQVVKALQNQGILA
jgi:hypothetical protein